MLMKELPMYSPHPRAKLYERFSDKCELADPNSLTTDADKNKFVVELNNYFNYHSFKWVFDGDIQNDQQEQMPGLVNKSIYVAIRTNTLKFINPGDIVCLKCGMWPQGKYFIVTGQPKQDYIYTPKMRQSYQHIELRSLI